MMSAFIETIGSLAVLASIAVKVSAYLRARRNRILHARMNEARFHRPG